MDISSVLNTLVCTCDTDSNAKLDKSELGTTKCHAVQNWILTQTIGSTEFWYIDGNKDDFIDVQEFHKIIKTFGFITTTTSTTTSTTPSTTTTSSSTTTTTTPSTTTTTTQFESLGNAKLFSKVSSI